MGSAPSRRSRAKATKQCCWGWPPTRERRRPSAASCRVIQNGVALACRLSLDHNHRCCSCSSGSTRRAGNGEPVNRFSAWSPRQRHGGITVEVQSTQHHTRSEQRARTPTARVPRSATVHTHTTHQPRVYGMMCLTLPPGRSVSEVRVSTLPPRRKSTHTHTISRHEYACAPSQSNHQ